MTLLVNFSDILISEPTTQKERFCEKKVSRITKCVEKNGHAMYLKNDFYTAIVIKDDT